MTARARAGRAFRPARNPRPSRRKPRSQPTTGFATLRSALGGALQAGCEFEMVHSAGGPGGEQRVLIFAPAGRDSAASRSILSRAGIETMICTQATALRREMEAGVGALLLGEEALTPQTTSTLADVLARQPS